MSVRRDTKNRWILYRVCATCGQHIVITAETPFVRQIQEFDSNGRKHQYTRYFCTASCKQASYKHLFDGRADERKRARDAQRDIQEKNRRYYAAHAEQERERQKRRYWEMSPHERAENNRFNKAKIKNRQAAVMLFGEEFEEQT